MLFYTESVSCSCCLKYIFIKNLNWIFQDSWSDKVFRQIRWKIGKERGSRHAEPTNQTDWQTITENEAMHRPNRQPSQPCPALLYTYPWVWTSQVTIKYLCDAYVPSLMAKSGAIITITLLLSVINRLLLLLRRRDSSACSLKSEKNPWITN